MRNYRKSTLQSGVALICLLATPSLVLADADVTAVKPIKVAATDKAADTIETIVVTAEKRAENSQDIPISLTAISGADLDKTGIKDIATLGFQVPSLRFGAGVTGGENEIVIRGLSDQNTTPFGEFAVSYNVNGIYIGRSTSIDPEFFDVDHVEVLRGPQGTLYGRNAVGGAINIVTAQPTDDFSGHVDAMVGDYNARTFRGWANVPLYNCGECQINFRITAVSANHDGYQKNVDTSPTATHDADGEDYQMLRAQLDFKFNSDIDLLIAASTNSEKDPVAERVMWNEVPGRYTGQIFYNDPRVVDHDYPENYDYWSNSLSATLNWNLGGIKLTSVSAGEWANWWQTTDDDGSGLDIGHAYWGSYSSQYSQELRLASNDDTQPLKWITGLFFYRELATQLFDFVDTGLNAPLGTGYVYDSPADLTTVSYAAFGQLDYDLAKTTLDVPLTLTFGLRYSHDHKYGDGTAHYLLPEYSIDSYLPDTFDANWAQFTPKFSVAYKFNDDVMAYATVSKGYQAGGYLVVVYNPEELWSYETGLKSQWFDNRLQLNGDVSEKITNQQIFIQNATGTRMENAGRSHDEGLELEAVAIPVDNLKLNASVSLQSAKYDQYSAFDGRTAGLYPPGAAPLLNEAGHWLNYTPPYTVDLGAQYAIDTSVGTFTPRIDVFTSGTVYFEATNAPTETQKPYTFVNLNLNWIEPKGRWTIDAFVHNLTNKTVISDDALQSGSFGLGYEPDNYTYYPPRTMGVRFGVNF